MIASYSMIRKKNESPLAHEGSIKNGIYYCLWTQRGGGYSGIQVSGMIEGLFRFESFDSGICMGRKISQAFFWVASFKYRFFGGVQNNLKIRGSARVSRPRSCPNKVQPNLFCGCLMMVLQFHKTGYTIVRKVSRGVSKKVSIRSIEFSFIVFIVRLYHHWNSLLL